MDKIPKKEILKKSSKEELNKLILDINKKFGLEQKDISKLIKNETLSSTQKLRDEIENGNNEKLKNIKEKELVELLSSLKQVLELEEKIKKESKLERELIKNEVERLKEKFENIDISNFTNYLETLLPSNLIEKAKNPKFIHEHILGASLGLGNSIFSITEVSYKVLIGIIKCFYDLYLMFSGKGILKNLTKI